MSNVIPLPVPAKRRAAPNKKSLTKATIDKLPFATRDDQGLVKQAVYWDSDLPGFGLVVGESSKTFVVQRDVAGKSTRRTIDRYGVITPAQARERAKELLLQMGRGIDPKVEERKQQAQSTTLQQALDAFLDARKNKLKQNTRDEYRRSVERYLADWLKKPLRDISPVLVLKKHAAIAESIQASPRYKNSKARGHSTANGVMVVLRALWNYSAAVNPELPDNPVKTISNAKTWFREAPRSNYIKPKQLTPWVTAILRNPNEGQRDYALLVLFTGLRREEAATLQWSQVDLDAGTLHLPETKNGKPLTLPLSDYLHWLLTNRKTKTGDSPWVFPADSESGHIAEPRAALEKAEKECAVRATIHDLRRTFLTIAESCDLPYWVLKSLANHSTGSDGDVTGSHYIQMSVERMRPWMQKITDAILNALVSEP